LGLQALLVGLNWYLVRLLLLKALLQVVNSLILLKESRVLLLGTFLYLELESVKSGLVLLIGLAVLGDFGNGVVIDS
jgi:hypothetical protein